MVIGLTVKELNQMLKSLMKSKKATQLLKKLLLLIIVIMAVALVAQRLKLVIFFPNTSKLPNYVSPVPQDQTAKILIPTMTKENNRTYLGIRYKMIDKQTAKLNKISEGAYITQVID